MFETKIYNCLYNQNLMGKKSSVHNGNLFRFYRAKEQLEIYNKTYQELSNKNAACVRTKTDTSPSAPPVLSMALSAIPK